MSLHSDTLSVFRANYNWRFLLNAGCQADNHFRLCLDLTGTPAHIYNIRGEHAYRYTTDTVVQYSKEH